uniref:transient receptor potential cation channel subfamily M member-like 2 isoform X2 n=1 Tax=Styela clava TaxID=7725 RepID=UPI00193AC3EF|nr:transient receptor potential cation channel subfamily M member-like 2 isoform X2 [Styela clava]
MLATMLARRKSRRVRDSFYDMTMTDIQNNDTEKFISSNIKMKGLRGENVKTNAYGEIDFVREKTMIAKYVRAADDTDEQDLYDLLNKYWKLNPPNLIISVTGGAKNFALRTRLKEVFRKSLIKAAKKTGAWITSGGTHVGVMKHVGKAVESYETIKQDRKRVITIGIAPWGAIFGNEKLVNMNTEQNDSMIQPPKVYDSDMTKLNQNETKQFTTLDDNHSHFILVDNGSTGESSYGTEIELRAKLEEKIKKENSNVRIVCVVVQGGPGTLKTVKSTIEKDIPVVLVSGSGGCADVLASALKKGSDNLEEGYVKQLFKEFNYDNTNSHIELVKDCISGKELITVFELDPNDTSKDLDFAILDAVLRKKENDVNKNLDLAVAWNRSDYAKSHILNDGFEKGKFTEIFMGSVLLNDKHEFCKVLLDYGVNLKHVEIKKIVDLYKKDLESSRKFGVSGPQFRNFNMSDVGKRMAGLFGTSYASMYQEGNAEPAEKYFDPYMEIFRWALLFNHREIAKYIWEYMHESMAAAVMATKILKALASTESNYEVKNQMLADADEYERHAVIILGKLFADDESKAIDLLKTSLPRWGRLNCLHVAFEAKDKAFISHPAVQFYLDQIWSEGLMKEKESNRDACSTEFGNSQSGGSSNNLCKQIVEFRITPVRTFRLNIGFYLIYLILFSAVILSSFDVTPSTPEIVLDVWATIMMFDEIREVIGIGAGNFTGKDQHYFKDQWNYADILSFLLFYIAFITRWFGCSDCLYVALTLYCISFMIQCVRIIHIFAVNSTLGPKIIMVKKMIKDLLTFLFILAVFLLAYGVASQALLYPNETDFAQIIVGIIYKPYWQIYGELFLDEINYNPNLGSLTCNDTDNDLPRCPHESVVVPILSAVYLFFANILLLNLLIAMFSYTFDKVQSQGKEVWMFQRYSLIVDYCNRPPLPPPLVIFCHIYYAYQYLKCYCKKQERENGANEKYEELRKWEHWFAEEYIDETRKAADSAIDKKIEKLSERIESNTHKLDDILSTIFNLQDMMQKSHRNAK